MELIQTLLSAYPLGTAILGEDEQKDFIHLFGAILRIKNILTSFDDFAGNEIGGKKLGVIGLGASEQIQKKKISMTILSLKLNW